MKQTMDLRPPSAKHMNQLTSSRYPSFSQIERPPLDPSSFELPFHGVQNQDPLPLHHGSPPFDRAFHYYNWQMPVVEYVTDIKPNDGK